MFAYILGMLADRMEKSAERRRVDPRTEEPIGSLGRYSFLEPGVEENPYGRPPSSRPPSRPAAPPEARAARPGPLLAIESSVQDEKRFQEVSPVSISEAEPIPLVHPRPTVIGARFVRSRTRAYANTLPFLSDQGARGLAPSPDTIDIRTATPNSLALASAPMVEDVPTSELYTAHGLYLRPDIVSRVAAEDRLPMRSLGSTALLVVAVVALVGALVLTALAERF